MKSRGYDVILANPLKIKLIAESRIKNDDLDSENLARLLMNGWIPESYVPDRDIREMRRIIRTRIQTKRSCTSYRNRIRFELLRMHVGLRNRSILAEGACVHGFTAFSKD